jgi:hypothetical protein
VLGLVSSVRAAMGIFLGVLSLGFHLVCRRC